MGPDIVEPFGEEGVFNVVAGEGERLLVSFGPLPAIVAGAAGSPRGRR